MPANPDALPWGQNDCSPSSIEQLNTIANLCDLKFSFGNLFVRAQSCFRDVLFNLPQLSVYNARQFLAHLRGTFGDLDLALPTHVDEQPLATCATYADGSLTSPTRPEWSLAGIGIVHNHRSSEVPLHSNESTFAYCEQLDGSLCLWAPLPGQFCSSTRAEVAAGLLALSSPRALSIGTDSACFLKPFLSLINTFWSPGKHHKFRPPKP